jgi:predicted kinase
MENRARGEYKGGRLGEMNPEKKDGLFFRPSVVVLSGTPLSGKNYLSERLAASSNFGTIDVDTVRHELDETRKKNGQVRLLPPDQEREIMVQSYTEMCRRTEEMVAGGIPVVMTGTFSRAEFKQPLERLCMIAQEQGFPFKAFLLTMSDEEVIKRIESRRADGGLSPIDSLDKYQWAKGFFKKIEFVPVVEIDSSKPNSIDEVLKNLKDLVAKP